MGKIYDIDDARTAASSLEEIADVAEAMIGTKVDFTNFQTNQDPNFDVNDVKSIVNESIGAIEIDEEIQPMELNFELYTT